jgi:di/tricarboxylate transporter
VPFVTIEISLVLSFLAVSIVFLVTEWIPMEVTALLTMGILAASGLLTPSEALSGFSNPAVVTVWAVFILSGGLTKTGVANVIGRHVLRLGGQSEILLITAIMVSAGAMSAFMNNVAVSALMLPVIMDISRQTDYSPSRLLMPLAYGSLLGGLTTLIGTPPNILVSDALRENGLVAFELFDYTPVGIVVMVSGVGFMVFVGRHLLPKRDVRSESSQNQRLDFKQNYDLENRLFQLRLAQNSMLVGKSIAQIRLRSLLGLNVVAITRKNRNILAPSPDVRLEGGDLLMVEGQVDRVNDIAYWCQLMQVKKGGEVKDLLSPEVAVFEARLAKTSSLAKKSLNEIGFRGRYKANVLATRIDGKIKRSVFQDQILAPGTALLLQGKKERLEVLKKDKDFDQVDEVPLSRLFQLYRLDERLLTMEVPDDPACLGKTLAAMRLGDALGLQILSIVRGGDVRHMPGPDDELLIGDRLIMQGNPQNMEIIKAMEGLKPVEDASVATLPELESEEVGFMEAILSPHTTLTGKTFRQLRFRDKFDLTALAIWRGGKVLREDLRDIPLHFGDALLLHGKRNKFSLLGQDPDFIVLTETAQDVPRTEKMGVSITVFTCVLLSVILGLLPIHIAAVIGAAFMVMTQCMTMEDAYRFIEWKAVFLIAGMLPLGVALDKTGAALFLAEGVVALVGPFGPLAVMGGIVGLTFLATCFVPTAALVVIMAPIALKTAADMGMAPHALMMAVAIAASASFMTPVSHPANILVMGPGGYRFLDYIKIGLPLTLVVFLALLITVPFFWPLGL